MRHFEVCKAAKIPPIAVVNEFSQRICAMNLPGMTTATFSYLYPVAARDCNSPPHDYTVNSEGNGLRQPRQTEPYTSNLLFENLNLYEQVLRDPSSSVTTLRVAVSHLKAARIRERAALDEVTAVVCSRQKTIELLIASLEKGLVATSSG